MIHLNIASLALHIDELKSLLCVLDHPFDVIGITETRIKDGLNPLVDVTLEGYEFIHTPTKTACGLYIKQEYEYELKKQFTKSEENI